MVGFFDSFFVGYHVFPGFLVALLNAQVGQKEIYSLCNNFGILPCVTMSFILMNGRWFGLICRLHMCRLLSLFLFSSSCFCSVSMYVSKLYGVLGSRFPLPSIILLGCFMTASTAWGLAIDFIDFIDCMNSLYLLPLFQLLMKPQLLCLFRIM